MDNSPIIAIGHSTHPIDEFIRMLQAYEIKLLFDVRTVPGSRRNPQFNASRLERELQGHEIGYLHLKELGGLRPSAKDSINTAWRNFSFRGYSDYMQTRGFRLGVECLLELAQGKQSVIMRAEAVPGNCHRSLIGDALLVRGVQVIDILDEKTSKPHEMTPRAKVDGIRIAYPGTGSQVA